MISGSRLGGKYVHVDTTNGVPEALELLCQDIRLFEAPWAGTKGARTDILFNDGGVLKVDHATSKRTGYTVKGGSSSFSKISKAPINIREISG